MTTLDGLVLRDDSGTHTTEEQAKKIKSVRRTVTSRRTRTGPPSPTSSATHWCGDCRFFIGMERMTTQVSGLVMAYDNEREGSLVPHPRLEAISVPLPGAPDRI